MKKNAWEGEKKCGGNGFLIADIRFQIDLDVDFWAENGGVSRKLGNFSEFPGVILVFELKTGVLGGAIGHLVFGNWGDIWG